MPLDIRWEGDRSSNHSLAIVNREILRHLATFPDLNLMGEECAAQAHVTVRHQWPPNHVPPRSGERLVVMQPWEYGSIPRRWFDAFLLHTDEVWVYSSYNRDAYVRAGLPAEKVHVIPLGVSDALLGPPRPYVLRTRKRFRFLFVGGTIQRKGIDVLLSAYRKAFTRHDDVCLVIKDFGVGTYYRNQTAEHLIRDLQREANAPEIEYITDELSTEELRDLYHACHCLVHPYRGEGFGLPMAEAMACGLPVIATETGGASDFCTPSTALLIPATERALPSGVGTSLETLQAPSWMEPNVHVLAEQMRAVYEAPDRYHALAHAGQTLIRERFTWAATAETVAARLRALCASHAPPLSIDPIGQAAALSHAGARFWEQGDTGGALQAFTRAVALERSSDNRFNQAATLLARSDFRTALPILQELNDRLDGDLSADGADLRTEVGRMRDACAAALAAHALPESARLKWFAALYNASGYADESRNFLFGILDRVPFDLRVEAIDRHMGRDFLTEEEFQTIEALADKPATACDIDFQHITPEDFRYPGAPISIARTMFETDGIPEGWAQRCNLFTEVWVPSEFNVETFARAGVVREKLRIVPGCIDLTKYDRTTIQPMNIPGTRGFRFLSVFDFQPRKGWDVLLDGYFREFSPDDDVTLVIKVTGFHARDISPEQQIRRFIAEKGYRHVPRFTVIDGKLTEQKLLSLYASCDAFVLPSRGEGWGRPYMEAMALGLPTIATRWSAHLAFMNDANSFLVETLGLEPCEKTWDNPLYRAQQWAVPDPASLRAQMRRVYEDRAEAERRGARARIDIATHYDRPVVARQFLGALMAVCNPSPVPELV